MPLFGRVIQQRLPEFPRLVGLAVKPRHAAAQILDKLFGRVRQRLRVEIPQYRSRLRVRVPQTCIGPFVLPLRMPSFQLPAQNGQLGALPGIGAQNLRPLLCRLILSTSSQGSAPS